LCARQGAPSWRWKSSTDPTRGTVSCTARAVRVTGRLKEAGGKALARRTGSGYEAASWGEQAKICEARYVYGTRRRRSDAHKRDRGCAIPGEIWRGAVGYECREVLGCRARSQPRP
jgi:hypothetical protein